jgi:mannose-6-phosphate isomerase-like protein (cupin superfamily)
VKVIKQADLPLDTITREFVGAEHGGIGICVLFVEADPGKSVALHRHPYPELLIVQEGRARAHVGDEEREVGAGDIVIVPASAPHRFVNIGTEILRQVDIHVSPRFITEWL